MSWLFSRALVEASSAASCSDGKLFAQLNVTPTQHPFSRNGKTTDTSGPFLFGLTCAVLTVDRGAELLTLYRADFLAKTCPSPELAQGLTAHEAGCGESLRGSLARFDRDSHSLKTVQDSLFSDSTACSVTLPRSGSMRNGECFQRPILERPMTATVSGSSRAIEMFPTPTVHGNYNAPKDGTKRGTGLATHVRKYPTPTASASKGWSKNHNRANTDDRLDYTVEREAHNGGMPGRLNPMWEEWLMAWPIGWTQLKPLAMDRFQEWLRQHSPL